MDNSALADQLEVFAALLDLNVSYYTVRAYRRAAELYPRRRRTSELVRAGRVRELAGIGPGIETRLREFVETGRMAEMDELEAQALPEPSSVSRACSASRRGGLRELGHGLGIRTLAELQEAAAAGQLDTVPGSGWKTAARIGSGSSRCRQRAAAARHAAQPGLWARGRDRRRARREFAGDPMRGMRPLGPLRRCRPTRAAREAEALPQLVAVLERDARRGGVAVTGEGYLIEIVAAPAERYGTELVRATGSDEYVASLGRLPEAASEEDVRRARDPVPPARVARGRAWPTPVDLLDLTHVRGDLHVHTTASDGKASVEEMGRGWRSATSTSPSATHT